MSTYQTPSLFHGETDNLLKAALQELAAVETQLNSLPEGTATVFMCSGRRRIKGTLNGKPHFFNQRELPLARQLIMKKYLTIRKEELLHKINLLRVQVEYEYKWMGKPEMYLMENPERAALISDCFREQNQLLSQWMTAPCSCSASHQEERTEETPAGYKVRSKSEVMIIIVLLEEGRYFRYEDPLYINGITYHPDFTIRNPLNGKCYWYEHFGKMDDPVYAKKAYQKLADYAACGIIPSVNLIVTFETKTRKLSISQVKRALSILDQ